MAAAGIGIQVGIGIIEILKAYNSYKLQNPGMTEEEALQGFADGVSDFSKAVGRWHDAGDPPE